jgi:hypothetical protein
MSFNLNASNQNHSINFAKPNHNKLESIISPSPQILTVLTIDYNTTQTISFNDLLGSSPILKIINVPNTSSTISLPSDNDLQNLFENPLVGSVLSFIVQTNTYPLVLLSQNSTTTLNNTINNIYIQVTSLNPFTIELQQITSSGTSYIGPTGPIGPIGYTGPIGPIGYTGPIGPSGSALIFGGTYLTHLNSNTALGGQAAQTLIGDTQPNTSIYNTAIGYRTLIQLYNSPYVQGSFNTAIGGDSMFGLNNGANNTAIGCQSLYNNGSGNSNVAIGGGAGFNLSGGETNIYIGYSAYSFSDTTSSNNEIVIGANARGYGSNTAVISATGGLYYTNPSFGSYKYDTIFGIVGSIVYFIPNTQFTIKGQTYLNGKFSNWVNPGLYEFNLTASALLNSNGSLEIGLLYNTDTTPYASSNITNNTTSQNYLNFGFSQLLRINSTTDYIQISVISVSLLQSISDMYFTCKFISL